MKNSIVSCKYIALQIKTVSPICVSSGVADYSDTDVMRNGDGEVFIPGTSLAGAFRSYIENAKNQESIFGYSESDKGHMSSVYVSDIYFDKDATVSIRDQVQLDENKQVNNKFDTEIIETGLEGKIYIHYVVRQNDKSEEHFEKELNTIIEALHKGYIRIGANKNRGFGRIEVSAMYAKRFDSNTWKEMLEFKSDYKNLDKYEKLQDFGMIFLNEKNTKDGNNSVDLSKYIKITIPLKLAGGISIRRYSTKPKEADFEHICYRKYDGPDNKKAIPVIPGSSWNGAIRTACIRILKDILGNDALVNKCIAEWFGYVKINAKEKYNNAKENARQSLIVFTESTIEGATEKVLSRNKVNRFDGSTVDTALYTEKAFFGGTTSLEVMIRKDDKYHYSALAGLIEMVIDDIKNGFVAVGGQTAIGRGIFEILDESSDIDWQGKDDNEDYTMALAKYLNQDIYKEVE